MEKDLSKMSLEELWQLFPIFLTEHQTVWSEWFEEEKSWLKSILQERRTIRISHIGSTSVGTICAKPIIDILIEISADCSMEEIKTALVDNGYICMSREEGRVSFNKGYTPNGFAKKVYHIHLRYVGDNDELYFRDYLLENQNVAKEYEKLKLRLWKEYEHNRDGYTNAKTGFIDRYTQAAKKEYAGRY